VAAMISAVVAGTPVWARLVRAGDSGRDRGSAGPRAEGSTLAFAGLAALGIVLELFIEKEDLLSGREHKLAVAIHTGE
jgi:hypothetical protein